eukprot:3954316-Prymnesium_polylepis.1
MSRIAMRACSSCAEVGGGGSRKARAPEGDGASTRVSRPTKVPPLRITALCKVQHYSQALRP